LRSDKLLGCFLDWFSKSVMSLVNWIPESEDVSCWGWNANSTHATWSLDDHWAAFPWV